MSRDFNKVILTGRLARDPDVRTTQGGQKNARISLACGRERKDKTTGEKKAEAEFHPVMAWGFAADLLEKYCRKGKLILVEGRLHSYDYTDKNNVRKWVTEVVADNIILMPDSKNNGQAAGASASSTPAPAPAAQYYPGGSDATSLRGEMGFEDEFDSFPLDFSEIHGGDSDVSIPF
ncbi:single-stranded DNA-binding protein [Cloacibacillus sp. An23]|uniref:single-stranded DNA-binding protein n=1 Tax=Cloacibacillus sp. An23 TaxID=1965591 RepID=UPI000B388318|nr:single-stranded DNA-binding protein [Cloacibacillus sp. An23]OUO94786.1 hypothetical protein B5F39_02645 [Cloacibacillus sp. An23]